MNIQNEAILEITKYLNNKKIKYVIIGGIAVLYWSEPRITRDIDLNIIIDINKMENIIDLILGDFKGRIPDAKEFALNNRVLLISANNNCPIDISFGLPGYEEGVYERAIDFRFYNKHKIKICSPEDLIIFKMVAGRARDIEDVRGITAKQKGKLELEYIRKWLKVFSNILENDYIINLFETFV
jgi:predicted nucleotidyltransferase